MPLAVGPELLGGDPMYRTQFALESLAREIEDLVEGECIAPAGSAEDVAIAEILEKARKEIDAIAFGG